MSSETPQQTDRRRRRRFLRAAVAAILVLVFAEAASRAFWWTRGVPPVGTARKLHQAFYPKLAAMHRFDDHDEDRLDVLLLGGSVLHNDYGSIEHILRERLTRETDRPVRIYNLAEPAHTSLDSYYKYRHVAGDRRLDLVVVYHGINEVRANNTPRERFRPDYSHMSWYRLINDSERRADRRRFVFPYTIKFILLKTLDRLGWLETLPTHRPDPESLEHGCDLKTPASLHANLEAIIALAAQRSEPVVLMTFAFHLPNNYSEEAFERRKLDYTAHAFPVELWGKPACVASALIAHNDVVRRIAADNPGVGLVDQHRLLPGSDQFFNDVCHLTHEGSKRFVDNVLPVLLEKLRP